MINLKDPRVAFYMRVSKGEQAIENQTIQLQKLADLEEWKNITIFQDEGISGAKGREERPGFDDLLYQVGRGYFDIVAAWSIDRLGREPKDLFELNALAQKKKVTLFFYQERIDTSTAAGELYFTVMAGMAKFERRRLQERVMAGLERARSQGKKLGRPTVVDPELIEKVLTLRQQGHGIKKISKDAGCAVGTVYNILDTAGETA